MHKGWRLGTGRRRQRFSSHLRWYRGDLHRYDHFTPGMSLVGGLMVGRSAARLLLGAGSGVSVATLFARTESRE